MRHSFLASIRRAYTHVEWETASQDTSEHIKEVVYLKRKHSHSYCVLFLDRQARRILNNPRNADRKFSTRISWGDNLHLLAKYEKYKEYIPCGDIYSDLSCMNFVGTPSNVIRNSDDAIGRKGNSIKRIIAEDTVGDHVCWADPADSNFMFRTSKNDE